MNKISFLDYKDIELIIGKCKHTFPIHIHKSVVVGMIIEGIVTLQKNNTKNILTKGNVFFIPPYTSHSFLTIDNKEYSYVSIYFKNTIFDYEQNINKTILKSKKYIEDFMSSDFNLEKLSAYICLSKFHLLREFKKNIGITPYQFYLQELIKKVKQGILEKYSLSDLAYILGFSDQSHLSNTFKKFMGISPLQYEKSYCNFICKK